MNSLLNKTMHLMQLAIRNNVNTNFNRCFSISTKTTARFKKEEWNFNESAVEPVDKKEGPPNFLQLFNFKASITADTLRWLQTIDLTPYGIQQWWKRRQKEILDKKQLQHIEEENSAIVGHELAAAHFLINRGGKVKFAHEDTWVHLDELEHYELPHHNDKSYKIEKLDMSGLYILYEGLCSMRNIAHITHVNAAKCLHLDDFCLDLICGEYYKTLQYLDISHCPKITDKGITSLSRLRKLKELNIEGISQTKNIQLICLLLEESIPGLKIKGVKLDDELNTYINV